LDFASQHRKHLFPYFPIDFGGCSRFRADVLKGIRNITGINEEVDVAKTVEPAIRILPAVRSLVFIMSSGDAGNSRNWPRSSWSWRALLQPRQAQPTSRVRKPL
jgi:hypothetical protein